MKSDKSLANFFLSPQLNKFRSASENIAQREDKGAEVSEESINDREEIGVIEEENESVARESVYLSPDRRQLQV